MSMIGWALEGLAQFVSNRETTHLVLDGWMNLVAGLLQTVGTMVLIFNDINYDLFAKRYPTHVLVFALVWIVLYKGPEALSPPILLVNQVYWLPTLPFAYFLIRFREVLQMHSLHYPRFSTLFAYSLCFDVAVYGLDHVIETDTNSDGYGLEHHWLLNVVCGTYFLSGVALALLYWHLCNTRSRRLALSNTLYVYLLARGVCFLAYLVLRQYLYDVPIPLVDYAFSIIHIVFPLAYFALAPLIYPYLGRHWLKQRSRNAHIILKEQGIAPHHGSLAAVQRALSAGSDLNAHIEHNADDDFTLLTLACLNGHEDAVDLLLKQNEAEVVVLVNKGSNIQNWTPLYAAAMQGHSAITEKLLLHGADVHAKTEDDQSALLVATASGHTQITRQLMEAGARKRSAWMGVDAPAAAEELGREDVLVTLYSYESHFEGNILAVEGCKCVVSWPGVYAKSWDQIVAQSKQDEHSAAVVFLPQDTLHYGKCGSDKCYCTEVRLFPLSTPSTQSPSLPSLSLSPVRCTARRRSGAANGECSRVSLFSSSRLQPFRQVPAVAAARHQGRLAQPATAGLLLRRPSGGRCVCCGGCGGGW
jgi:hypothetical protein